jgi:hypothetical protein
MVQSAFSQFLRYLDQMNKSVQGDVSTFVYRRMKPFRNPFKRNRSAFSGVLFIVLDLIHSIAPSRLQTISQLHLPDRAPAKSDVEDWLVFLYVHKITKSDLAPPLLRIFFEKRPLRY